MRNSARHLDLNYGVALYQEKITWPIWLWVFLFFMASTLVLAIWAALSSVITLISAVVLSVLIIYSYFASALWITVTKGWLIVGPAAIERAFIYNFNPLQGAQLRATRGVDANPASYLQLRFWAQTGIKIDIRDPKDKTPYWLISTNRANELSKILNLADH